MSISKRLRISKNREFREIYKHGKNIANKDFVLYQKKNEFNRTRIGIAVSKIVGNAVKRNRIKRLIREIYRKELPHIKSGYDIILIARKPIKEKSFHSIEKTFIDVLKRAGLYIKNEKYCNSVN